MQPAPTALNADRLLSVREVAQRLNVSVNTVRRYVQAGHLPAVRLTPTAQLRFKRRDVDALIENGRGGTE